MSYKETQRQKAVRLGPRRKECAGYLQSHQNIQSRQKTSTCDKGGLEVTAITDALKKELEALVKEGKAILLNKQSIESAKELIRRGYKDKKIIDLAKAKAKAQDATAVNYQKWYTRTLPVIQQLLPERLSEFQEYYRLDKRNKRKEIDINTYTISDYLSLLLWPQRDEEAFRLVGVFLIKFQRQIDILDSAFTRIDSILANIKGVLQSELFEDELSTASELLKKGHRRSAGAVAGVIIERHLSQVATAHSLPIRKKYPTISDLNDAMKNANILDVPDWRFVQRLGDIRNLCVHSKDREPTKEEVEELVQGAEKVVKTFF